MSNVQILADSTCDLPPELAERMGIGIIPLYVLLGEKTYRDGVDIDQERIFAHFDRTQQTPTTSAPSVQDFADFFAPYARQKKDIVFIGISADMSATCQNAMLAAREFPDVTIRVVDSRSLSSGIGLLVVKAAQLSSDGCTADDIADRITALTPRVRASFVIDTLTYLYRGGRCSKLQMMGANALNLKPRIVVRDGRMSPDEKYRGRMTRVAPQYARQTLGEEETIDPERAFVTHSRCQPEVVASVMEVVRSSGRFHEVHDVDCGSVIASHCGPGTIGVLFIARA